MGVSALVVTIRPPFEERVKAPIRLSISARSCTLIALTSTATRGACHGRIRSIRAGLGVWSRSVGESAKLIPHSGRDYGPGTSRLRHDHARRPNCDTAIEGSAQGTSGAAWAEPQDSCQVA